MDVKRRQSMTKEGRQKALEETTRVAKESAERDRESRQKKTDRLRAARLQGSKTP